MSSLCTNRRTSAERRCAITLLTQLPEYRSGIHLLTPRFIKDARSRGIDVHVWTVNEAEAMQRMMDLGVDGIIADRPDILLELLGRSSAQP